MISAKKNHFIVEFRPSTIRAARISSDTAPTVVEDVIEIDLAKETDPSAALRTFSGAKATGYLHAVCSVFPERRLVRQILLDAQRGKEVAFVLDYLKNTVGVDPDSYSVYCLSTQDGADVDLAAFNKKNILLCGSPKSDIEEIQESLVGAGIYPSRLEIGTIGAIGSLKDTLSEAEDGSPILFLEIDKDTTNALIIGLKGVEMARRIDCGSGAIISALKEEMNLKDEHAAEKILLSRDFDLGSIAPKLLRRLLRELQSSIGFFEVQTGNSVSQLYCLKEGKSLAWLENSICDLLNLTPLQIDLKDWLGERGITLSSGALYEKVDATWLGLFSLALEFGKEKAAS